MKASFYKHILEFKKPSGTSRGIIKTKETWFIVITHNKKQGIGECGILRSLSIDDRIDYEDTLKWTCENIHIGKEKLWQELIEFPSIQFGVEMAFRSLESSSPFLLHPSDFTSSKDVIPINGLVWMGDKEFMKAQIIDRIEKGFHCIKLKIGAIDFKSEIKLLSYIRSHFSSDAIEIRVDANGAFHPNEALHKLNELSVYNIHSIEQPIRQGQFSEMKKLCIETPIPIALDEELIGVFDRPEKESLLQTIQPQYIILKPSLIGGYKGTQEWIDLANKYDIGWWVTSALESNIGLNAIAQYTYTLQNELPQGLGTGSLYTNNLHSPLEVNQGTLKYSINKKWEVPYFN